MNQGDLRGTQNGAETDVDFPRLVDFHASGHIFGGSHTSTHRGEVSPKAISAKSHQTLCRPPQGVWTPPI